MYILYVTRCRLLRFYNPYQGEKLGFLLKKFDVARFYMDSCDVYMKKDLFKYLPNFRRGNTWSQDRVEEAIQKVNTIDLRQTLANRTQLE